MAEIYIGSFGEISIRNDAELQARLAGVRQRVSGQAGRTPRGKQIRTALSHWQMAVREALSAQHGQATFDEYRTYTLDVVPLDDLLEAERLLMAAQSAPSVMTYQCRMQGCQHRVAAPGDLCGQCQHDED